MPSFSTKERDRLKVEALINEAADILGATSGFVSLKQEDSAYVCTFMEDGADPHSVLYAIVAAKFLMQVND